MLQQILQDMYIDPDVLDALNEDQKKTLFLKMRQEQVRRWQEREEKLEREGGDADLKRTKPKKAKSKNVNWLLGRDGDVAVVVIGEVDELSSKFICSGLGQKKSHPSLQNNTHNRSILTNRKTTTEPNRTERANLSPATSGTQLNKAKCEESSTLHPLPVSVSEHSFPLAAEQPELKAASTTKETSTPQLSICSMLLMRASPVNVRAASATVTPGSVHDLPGVAGLKSTTATQPPSPSNTASPGNASITKALQEDQLSHKALNDKAQCDSGLVLVCGGAVRGSVSVLFWYHLWDGHQQNGQRALFSVMGRKKRKRMKRTFRDEERRGLKHMPPAAAPFLCFH